MKKKANEIATGSKAALAMTVERWVLPQPPGEIATGHYMALAMTIRQY